MIGLIDTNLLKKLTKNTNNIHDGFLNTIGRDVLDNKWVVSAFGWLEYIGLALRGSIEINPMPPGWELPTQAQAQYAHIIDAFGAEYAKHVFWVRSQARSQYAQHLTAQILAAKAAEDQQFHSDVFSKGPFTEPMFRMPLRHYSASDIVELLSIDYLHRHQELPPEFMDATQWMHRATMIAEYYVEKRNIILFRAFKQIWNSRTKGNHESLVKKETLDRLERAVNRLKSNADRFDHDLLGYFLLGFAINGTYEPVMIYTQDSPEEILCRLAVFHSIINYTWNEFRHLEGVRDTPFQLRSHYCFISDNGSLTRQIGFRELTQFLRDEHLIVNT